jgi:hypothetical protein
MLYLVLYICIIVSKLIVAVTEIVRHFKRVLWQLAVIMLVGCTLMLWNGAILKLPVTVTVTLREKLKNECLACWRRWKELSFLEV